MQLEFRNTEAITNRARISLGRTQQACGLSSRRNCGARCQTLRSAYAAFATPGSKADMQGDRPDQVSLVVQHMAVGFFQSFSNYVVKSGGPGDTLVVSSSTLYLRFLPLCVLQLHPEMQ